MVTVIPSDLFSDMILIIDIFRHANDKCVEKVGDLHPDMVVKVLGLFFLLKLPLLFCRLDDNALC